MYADNCAARRNHDELVGDAAETPPEAVVAAMTATAELLTGTAGAIQECERPSKAILYADVCAARRVCDEPVT